MLEIFRPIQFWDCDGVIIDSNRFYYETVCLALEAHGIKRPTNEIFIKLFFGRPSREGIRDYLHEGGLEDNLESVWEYKCQFDPQFSQWITYYDDALRLMNLTPYSRRALVTGNRRNLLNQVLGHTFLQGRFETIVSYEDYQNGKPSPEPYNIACGRLMVPGKEYPVGYRIGIEDSVAGVKALEKAGILSIAVTNTTDGEVLKKAGATLVVARLDDPLVVEIFNGKERL